MRSTTFFIAALAIVAGRVAAQDDDPTPTDTSDGAHATPTGIPACAMTCAQTASSAAGCSGITDIPCLCASGAFPTVVGECISTSCSEEDQAAARSLLCANETVVPTVRATGGATFHEGDGRPATSAVPSTYTTPAMDTITSEPGPSATSTSSSEPGLSAASTSSSEPSAASTSSSESGTTASTSSSVSQLRRELLRLPRFGG
ncbi:hypothetical protein FRC04_000769 [Tulasnella sp. 424]|nr:hypothetical protein FRC04_000769 [Tulasnella sp. 424]